MPRYFKIKHLGAGLWPKDAVVNENDIRVDGFDLDAWLRDGAVEETEAPSQQQARTAAGATPANRPANPAPHGGVQQAAAAAAGRAESPIARAPQLNHAGPVTEGRQT